ncbi:MAG: hypothetical protein WC718_12525 [Phycisphaerales bacterium]|jgi:hypothetical protein
MSEIIVRLSDGRRFAASSTEALVQWAREGRIPADAMIEEAGIPPIVAAQHPALKGVLTPPMSPPQFQPSAGDEMVATVIPYRNKAALVGYYVSIGSLIPGLGLLLGPAAMVLGVMGIKRVRAEPKVRGTAHAIVALVLGSITTLGYWGLVVGLVVTRNRR